MIVDFVPRIFEGDSITHLDQPFFQVDIEARRHDNTWYRDTDWFDKSLSSAYYETVHWNGAALFKLKDKSSQGYMTLTTTMDVMRKGLYRVKLRLKRGPKETGNGYLTVGSKTFDTINAKSGVEHLNTLDLGLVYLSSGTTNISLGITKYFQTDLLIIQEVEQFSTQASKSKNRLDVSEFSFTENSVNEMNVFDLECDFKESFWLPENPASKIVFDISDSITIWLGKNLSEVKPMFGGYLTSFDFDDGTLSLGGVDRMLDMTREPLYLNFAIGGASSASSQNKSQNFVSLPDIYSTTRYLANSLEYPIISDNCLAPPPPNYSNRGIDIDFKEAYEFNNINAGTRNSKALDKSMGNGKPCLRLMMKASGQNAIRIWEDVGNPVQAVKLNYLLFDYFAKGNGTKFPFLFDVMLKMHKYGETVDQRQNYFIQFTGKNKNNNIIGSVKPTLNGKWHRFAFDMERAFNSMKYPSEEYWVSGLYFYNWNSNKALKNKGDRVMWFDNFKTVEGTHYLPVLLDQDAPYPNDVLAEMCERTNSVAYIDYGRERRFDSIRVLPQEYEILDEAISDGHSILEIQDLEYSPRENICNASIKRYNVNSSKPGTAYYENRDAIIRYGIFAKHEALTDIGDGNFAYRMAKSEVENNAIPKYSFTALINGSTNLTIGQLQSAVVAKGYLSGTYPIKSIDHKFSKDSEPQFTSEVGLGQPSARYRTLIRKLRKSMNLMYRKDARNLYQSTGSFTRGSRNMCLD